MDLRGAFKKETGNGVVFSQQFTEEYVLWLEEKLTSDNSKSMLCKNPLHNIQVEQDGRCHWCESKI